MIALVEARQARVGIAPLCDALGLARATFYRRRSAPPPEPSVPRARRAPRQTLTATERAGVLAVLHEERFVDLPPAQVWAQLLDAGQVPPCSTRTMYRVLAANAEARERRNQLRLRLAKAPKSTSRTEVLMESRTSSTVCPKLDVDTPRTRTMPRARTVSRSITYAGPVAREA
jgi:hypothetical protein